MRSGFGQNRVFGRDLLLLEDKIPIEFCKIMHLYPLTAHCYSSEGILGRQTCTDLALTSVVLGTNLNGGNV